MIQVGVLDFQFVAPFRHQSMSKATVIMLHVLHKSIDISELYVRVCAATVTRTKTQ